MTKLPDITHVGSLEAAPMPTEIEELNLLKTTVETLRALAAKSSPIATQMLALADELEDQAIHLERLLIRQRAIRPKPVR